MKLPTKSWNWSILTWLYSWRGVRKCHTITKIAQKTMPFTFYNPIELTEDSVQQVGGSDPFPCVRIHWQWVNFITTLSEFELVHIINNTLLNKWWVIIFLSCECMSKHLKKFPYSAHVHAMKELPKWSSGYHKICHTWKSFDELEPNWEDANIHLPIVCRSSFSLYASLLTVLFSWR